MQHNVTTKNQSKLFGKKLLLKIVIFGAVVFLSYLLWNYTKPDDFPIKRVKVFATYKHLTAEFIQKIISPYLADGFFHLNVTSIKQQLLSDPWVYAVSIRRRWPDLVIINIVEQHAILQWGLYSLINPAGVFFTPPPATLPQNLPLLFGPEQRATEIFSLYQKISLLLEPLDLSIKRLLLNPQHYFELALNNDTTIYLKENDPIGQVELLAALYRKITADHEIPPKSIDLRYNTGFAIRWD